MINERSNQDAQPEPNNLHILESKNKEISDLKSQLTENISKSEKIVYDLQSRIKPYKDKETILAKYTKNELGYYVHNETKKPFCPRCMQLENPHENELTQDEYFIGCESCPYQRHIKPLPPEELPPDDDEDSFNDYFGV